MSKSPAEAQVTRVNYSSRHWTQTPKSSQYLSFASYPSPVHLDGLCFWCASICSVFTFTSQTAYSCRTVLNARNDVKLTLSSNRRVPFRMYELKSSEDILEFLMSEDMKHAPAFPQLWPARAFPKRLQDWFKRTSSSVCPMKPEKRLVVEVDHTRGDPNLQKEPGELILHSSSKTLRCSKPLLWSALCVCAFERPTRFTVIACNLDKKNKRELVDTRQRISPNISKRGNLPQTNGFHSPLAQPHPRKTC